MQLWDSICIYVIVTRLFIHREWSPTSAVPSLILQSERLTTWSARSFNPLRYKFFIGNIKMYLQFISFLHTDMTQAIEILPCVRQNLPILHSQYHGCWCPGNARSQGISKNDIYFVELGWVGHRMLRVNKVKIVFSDFVLTKDTPYLAIVGKLWGVSCENLWENWSML